MNVAINIRENYSIYLPWPVWEIGNESFSSDKYCKLVTGSKRK